MRARSATFESFTFREHLPAHSADLQALKFLYQLKIIAGLISAETTLFTALSMIIAYLRS